MFLVHRMPYPPNKGDKIRSFNLLKQLSSRYRVHLGTFVDNSDDIRYLPDLRTMCHDLRAEVIRPKLRKLASARGLLSNEALSLPYYRHRRMVEWVRHTLASNPIRHVLIFSSPMAQYVLDEKYASLRRIADFVDVDSEKWRQYSGKQGWPMNWLYRREGAQLLHFEREVAARFDATFFVSHEEAGLFRRLAPEVSQKVGYVNNGVNTKYFSATRYYENPYPQNEWPIVFTGAMDYWANIDAVNWFSREVFPCIIDREPRARFYIVGSRPVEEIRKLDTVRGIRVIADVHDIRPYLFHARFVVAPLRVGRGIQNKVLEAMAMAKPVLATPAAMEGICAPDEFSALVSDDPDVLVERAVDLLKKGDSHGLGGKGRELVLAAYSWDRSWQQFEPLLHGHDPELGAMRLSA